MRKITLNVYKIILIFSLIANFTGCGDKDAVISEKGFILLRSSDMKKIQNELTMYSDAKFLSLKNTAIKKYNFLDKLVNLELLVLSSKTTFDDEAYENFSEYLEKRVHDKPLIVIYDNRVISVHSEDELNHERAIFINVNSECEVLRQKALDEEVVSLEEVNEMRLHGLHPIYKKWDLQPKVVAYGFCSQL